MNEFDLIARYFAPLATSPAALGLKDDAAIISVAPGNELVITKDIIAAGTHFPEKARADDIASKALRVNLSDMAAMGATPKYYLIGLMLPAATEEHWIRNFTNGLARENACFGLSLLGGDTVSYSGPLAVSVTMFGEVPEGQAIKRSGAREGDIIYVSGTVGDGFLGLKAVLGELPGLSSEQKKSLISKYYRPEPQLQSGVALRGIANAMIDISDGLLADLSHICTGSGVGAQLFKEKIPLSDTGSRCSDVTALVTGGDDYELLFTVSPDKEQAIAALQKEFGVPMTKIGQVLSGNRVRFLDENNQEIYIKTVGYNHFQLI